MRQTAPPGSDGYSGITANPALGAAVDLPERVRALAAVSRPVT
jgi:altronate dehydratase